jgi:hypothetical protein
MKLHGRLPGDHALLCLCRRGSSSKKDCRQRFLNSNHPFMDHAPLSPNLGAQEVMVASGQIRMWPHFTGWYHEVPGGLWCRSTTAAWSVPEYLFLRWENTGRKCCYFRSDDRFLSGISLFAYKLFEIVLQWFRRFYLGGSGQCWSTLLLADSPVPYIIRPVLPDRTRAFPAGDRGPAGCRRLGEHQS